MKRMSLGPTGAALLRDGIDSANSKRRSTTIPTSQKKNTAEPSQFQTYFMAAIDEFIRDREEQGASNLVF
uniref:Uncharacterized protein n=1 Tax=Peronospora matthiolae TaxID=2874970 RepID=A0AAV1VFW9_9STRA